MNRDYKILNTKKLTLNIVLYTRGTLIQTHLFSQLKAPREVKEKKGREKKIEKGRTRSLYNVYCG